MLRGASIYDTVDDIANKKPIIKKIGIKNYKKLDYKNIDLIPCVNKFGKIKNLEITNENNILDFHKNNLDIILMAGGYGKRLMPYTKKIPKPLIKIKNKSVLEIAIENFFKYGFKMFYISIFYKAKIIKKYFNQKKFKIFKLNI